MALLAFVFFGFKFAAEYLYFHDPRHQDETLQDWMTPRYVALSYSLPRKVVEDLLDLPEDRKPRMRLDEVAGTMGISVDELDGIVRAGAAEFRASKK